MSRARPALVAFAVLLAMPATALGDRVVVAPVRGDRSGAIGRRVESALSERMDVIPWDDFRVGYRENGGAGAEAVRAACQYVRARRVVLGDVNSRRTVHLTALNCDTGEPDVELEVLLYNGSPERTALLDALATLVPESGASAPAVAPAPASRRRAAPPAPAVARPSVVDDVLQPRPGDPEPPPADAEEPEAEENASGELPPESEAPAAELHESAYLASSFGSGGSGSGIRSVLDDEGTGSEASSETSVEPPGGAPLSSILEASAGFVVATRSLSVPITDGHTLGYSGGGYTELGVQASVFPIAPFVRKPWARMFGLTGSIFQGVAMPVSGGNLQTSAVDGNFGVVGRIELGTKPIFDIRPSFTWGWWGFAITPNENIATFNYRFLRLGLEARMHLLDRKVSLGVSGGWRMVSDLGEATGTYGDSSEGAGWDVGASASIVLLKFLEISAGGEVVNFEGVYAGVGSLPDRQAISSSDMYPRGFLRAGVVLR